MTVALVNAVVTMQEAVDHLFKDSTAREADEIDALTRVINGVSALVARDVGPVLITTFTGELHDGGQERLFLRNRPVVSVTEVAENSVILTEGTDFYVYKDIGVLRRYGATWGKSLPWGSYLPQSVSVTYTAGYASTVADVPWDLKLAALVWIEDLWKQGPANLANVLTEGGAFIRPTPIPPQVDRMLRPWRFPVMGAI